jgi:hypothetical protein
MAKKTDWLPWGRQDQLAMARNWLSILPDKAAAWGIPTATVQNLDNLTAAANEALSLAITSARNAVINQQVRTAFGELTECMRDIKRRYFFIPPLTEADWVSLGLKLHDDSSGTIGPPTSVVSAEISYPHKNALALHITPIGGHAYDERPDWGFRVHYGVLPRAGDVSEEMMIERQYLRRVPQNPEELTISHFTHRKHDLIEFPYDNSGKQCFICVRYENGKGDAGPWGPMVSSFIP